MKKKKKKSIAPKDQLVYSKHQDGSLVAGPLPKHYWRDRKEVPSFSLEHFCREAYSAGHKVAAKLARIVDYRAVSIPYAAKNEDWLDEVGLDITDINPEVISSAQHILDKANQALRDKVHELDGTYNGIGKRIKQEQKELKEQLSEKGTRPKLFGHSVTAVIRAMAVGGFDFDMIKTVCKKMNVDAADNTIRTQIR